MGFSFDGPNRIINLTPGTTVVDVDDMYSAWKEWIQLTDNSKYLPAFDNSIGNNPLGNGRFAGTFFFLQNNWLIRPQEANHTLVINGNLYPIPETAPLFALTLGSFQVNIALERTNLAQGIETGGGSSIWSTSQRDQVISDTQIARRLLANRSEVDTENNQMVTYNDEDNAELYRQDLTNSQGNPSSTDIAGVGKIVP